MLKKIFAAVMSVVLVVGLCPTVALADTDDDIDTDANFDAENAVESDANDVDGLEDYEVDVPEEAEPIGDEVFTDFVESPDSKDIEGKVADGIFSSSKPAVFDIPFETQGSTLLSTTPLATYSGTLGTCTWELDDDGCLTIAPADGVSGVLNRSSRAWPWYGQSYYQENIKSVKVKDGVFASESLTSLFDNCYSLTSADLSGLDTSNATDMQYMFNYCTSLTSLDLSGFDTSNVTNMRNMFWDCTSLTSLDVSNFDTSNVTDMANMFDNCLTLSSLDLSSFNTSQVTSYSYFITDTPGLTYIVIGNNFDLFEKSSSSVTDIKTWYDEAGNVISDNYMSGINSAGTYYTSQQKPFAIYKTSDDSLTFYNTWVPGGSRKQRVYTNFLSSDYTSASSVPWYGDSIKNVYVDSTFANEQPSSCAYWFSECSQCESIDLTYLDTSHVTDMTNMFYGCSSLVSLDLSSFDTSNVTSTGSIFYGCSSLTSLDVSSFDTSNITDMASMFYGCESLTALDLSNFNTAAVTDMRYMFYGCTSLTSLDVSGFDTSNVAGMDQMFYGCSSLTALDLSNFNTAAITDMSSMFYGCSSLTSLDVSSFDTSNITDMASMFYGCESLTALDLSNFDMSAVTDMRYMFYGCSSLVSLNDEFTIPSGINSIESLFYNCASLIALPSDFEIPWGVTDMKYAFYGCASLASLPNNFSIPTGMENMGCAFSGCSSLKTLPDSFTIPYGVTNVQSCFYGCTLLVTLPDSFTIPNSVTDLFETFYGCTALTTTPAMPANTTDMSYAFYGCASLTKLPDIPTSVTDMRYAFYDCTSITYLPKGFTFPSRATTDNAFGLSDPYSRSNPLDTWCLESDYEYLMDSYDWVSSYRRLQIKEVANDRSALQSAIEKADSLVEDDYTAESWATLQVALSDAVTVYEDDFATQDEVDAAAQALNYAINTLVPAEGQRDTTLLAEEIQIAESLNSADYTPVSWAVMQSSLTSAKAVLEDTTTTQEEIDVAAMALEYAISSLVAVADTSSLSAAIARADALNSADYTPASWEVLQEALTDAKTVLDDKNAAQTEVDTATKTLNDAISALVAVADTSSLSAAIARADALSASDYTPASWEALQEALVEAKTVLNDKNATQTEVNTATKTLNDAIAALVPTVGTQEKTMTVYAGADRYETANLIASAVADTGTYDGVIVASAANGKFADALCASGLSGVLDYPVVLVDGSASGLDSDTKAVLSGLLSAKGDVIVLGGTSTVSEPVVSALSAYDSDGYVTRLSGDDRYATSEAIYYYGMGNGGWSTDYAVLAKGNDFPDALGAASFCTTNAAPMLLTNQNSETLSGYVTNAAIRADEVVIVGGTSSVSTAKENTLRNYATVERFGEATRYETNLAFAHWQLNHGMSIDSAGIATGTNFPDSLGSSYLLSLTSSVLLLTSKTESENAALYDLFSDNAQSISSISVFGGENSVSVDTRSAIQSAIGGEWKTVNKS